jgi:uncharacterized protein YcbX
MISITKLTIYPVKSLRGVLLTSVKTGVRGFEFDREWMITDNNYQFVTQRQIEKMATISVVINSNALILTAENHEPLKIILDAKRNRSVQVVVWEDTCEAIDEGAAASAWLTRVLGRYSEKPLRLVRFAKHEKRQVPSKFLNQEQAQSAFSDQFPYLITAEETLNYLNENLKLNGATDVTMDRFRANIVIKGLTEIEKKTSFNLIAKDGSYCFGLRKPCKRCKITTINQDTGEIIDFKEPLSTLTSLNFSSENYGAFFGQNAILLSDQDCVISVGDLLQTSTKK